MSRGLGDVYKRQSPVQYRLIDQVSDFGSGKGIPFARFDKLKIHDSVGFTIQFDFQTLPDIRGFVHGAYSGKKVKRFYADRKSN